MEDCWLKDGKCKEEQGKMTQMRPALESHGNDLKFYSNINGTPGSRQTFVFNLNLCRGFFILISCMSIHNISCVELFLNMSVSVSIYKNQLNDLSGRNISISHIMC